MLSEEGLEKLKDLLKKHEGLRLRPYRCPAGKLTIGVGRNLEDVGISEQEAFYLLENDCMRCVKELGKYEWFKKLDETRKIAIIDMVFNLGLPKFLKFKRTIAAIKKGDFKAASKEMLDSKWVRQVGERAKELARIIETGELGNQ